MTSYLSVERLSKTYHGSQQMITALDNVSFGVEQGEFVSLLGPSGCGKTTLLRTVAGLEAATRGDVQLAGRTVRKPGPELGVVFQEHRLFPWLSVEDNVAYGLARQGRPKAERQRESAAFLRLVGLSAFAKSYPKELSIGMSQRVGIARALATNPHVLLMDEPFASVDAQTRAELQRELLRIWQETRKTILFVTHSVDEAILLSQRIIVLSRHPGRVKQVITVDLNYPRDETEAAFNLIKRQVNEALTQ